MAGIKTNKDFGVYVEEIALQDPGFKASDTIDFQGTNPSDGNYLKLDGTQFTFKDSTANADDVKIGSDIGATIDNLLANSNLPSSATYTKVDTDKLFIEYKTIGDSGNNYTLACDFVTVDSHLNGGSDVPDPDWVQFDASIGFKPIELLLDSSTTDSTLCSYNYPLMKEGNKLLLTDSSNSVYETILGSITESGTLQTLDPNHIGSRISLDSTHNIATRNSDSTNNADSQVYGYAINKGNVYFEIVFTDVDANIIGISTDNTYQDNHFAYVSSGYGYNNNGIKYNNNSVADYGDAFGLNDVMGIRYCYETGELEFYKNGVSQGIAYTLTANTAVYPAISAAYKNQKVQMISDAKDMKFLPDDCVPYGMLKYSADISGLNLSKVPTKAFLDNKPVFLASMEPSKDRIIPNIVEKDKCILSGSTKDELHTSPIYAGEELLVDGNEVQIISDNLTIVDTVNDADPLEDGSQVAGYTFDNTESGGNVICMNDSSYNGQWKTKDSGGNIVDTDGSYDTGMFGNASSFTKNELFIEASNFNVGKNFTVSLWVNTSDSDVDQYSILSSCFLGDDSSLDINLDNHKIDFRYLVNGNWYITSNNKFTISDGNWHFVIITVDGKNIKLYVDSSVNVNTFVEPDNYSSGFIMGRVQNNIIGLIDQVRIFNRALTPDEISLLYKEQKAKYDISGLNLPATPSQVISKGYVDLLKDTSDTSSFTGLSPYVITIDSTDNLITDKGFLKPTGAITVDAVSAVDNADPLLDGSQVAGYQFEDSESGGNVTDMNGNYNGQWKTSDSNGNIIDTDGSYDTGKYGNAASFDGSHAIKLIGDVKSSGLDKSSTYSLWCNISDYSGTYHNFIGDYESSSGNDDNFNCVLRVDSDGNILYTFRRDGQTIVDDVSILNSIETNKWYHFLVSVKNKDEINVYVNGILVKSFNIQNAPDYTNTSGLYIGAIVYNGKLQELFNGLIDQVRIFNKALDPLEVQVLYNEQIQKYTIPLDSSSNAYQFCKLPQRTVSSKLIETTFDGTKFTAKFNSINKQGRAIQRRLIMPNNYLEVLPPFTSNMWKQG